MRGEFVIDNGSVLRIGAHNSVAGGVARAVDRAVLHGCEALQNFAKNANRWMSPPLEAAEIRRFRSGLERAGITPGSRMRAT